MKVNGNLVEASSFLVNPARWWAIIVEGSIFKILDFVIVEMGLFNLIQAKTVSDPAWQLKEHSWWVFKSDNQERLEIRVVACKKLLQPFPTPISCEFDLRPQSMERRLLQVNSISNLMMGNANNTKPIQIVHPTLGVFQHCVTLMPGRGYPKEMMQLTGWN